MLNDTITLNPSLLGFQPVASFSGTFNWLDGSQLAADDQQRTYNVSVIDGKNQYVNAGISFTRRPDLDFIHVALAKRATTWLSFGSTVKRFASRSNPGKLLANGQSGLETGLSASIAIPKEVSVTPLQIGFTIDNIFNRARDEKYTGPRQAGVGLKANVESMLMLYGDLVQNFSNFSNGSWMQWSGGAELAIGGGFFGRGGLTGSSREKGFGFGGGWVGPKIGVNYGYQNKLRAAERDYAHAVTMDVFM